MNKYNLKVGTLLHWTQQEYNPNNFDDLYYIIIWIGDGINPIIKAWDIHFNCITELYQSEWHKDLKSGYIEVLV